MAVSSIVAIELNDAGVLVGREGTLDEVGPGYALLEKTGLLTGMEAYRAARLKPTLVNNRFWDQLSTDPLPKPSAHARTYADLAHAHLADIWRRIGEAEGVIFAVPSNWAKEKLGLLLGIAQSCAMPAIGMVDSAVVAIRQGAPGRQLLHLDIQLHRAVLTHLDQADLLSRSHVNLVNGAGLIAIRESWVGLIASAFVRKTRFDPLHLAESEQQLYDRLPAWLADLEGNEQIELTMEFGGKQQEAVVKREQLVHAAGGVYQRLVQQVSAQRRSGEHLTLVLSHRVGQLLGLPELFEQLPGCEVITLQSGAAAWGALSLQDRIRSEDAESLRFVSKLPLEGELDGGAVRRPAVTSNQLRPTHLLYEGMAYPIHDEAFVVGANIAEGQLGINLPGPTHGISRSHFSVFTRGDQVILEDHSTYGTYINEERVKERANLRIGDRIRVGSPGQELKVIAVKDAHGT